ncbi:MAG: hypothetical protein DPW11_00675 [bacterium]|nr:hypothetical protein [Candidatus Microgenomates bacterium CPR3]MCQ3944282.1 hypothetical protein [bacterium]RIK52046.1 MAG: hypothetical protein DCC61_00550 [Candidatus Microgenomates bacterium]
MSRTKTREEKIKTAYRLQNFSLKVAEKQVEKDRNEFGYLSSHYVVKDLTKTLLYSLVILVLLMVARQYLG